MTPPDHEEASRDAIAHWSSLTKLAEFAHNRHGYQDSDGGFGVTYPNDLDEYDRVVDGIVIESGYVRIIGFWGLPQGYEVDVPETVYLDELSAVLCQAGHLAEAVHVQSLSQQQKFSRITQYGSS